MLLLFSIVSLLGPWAAAVRTLPSGRGWCWGRLGILIVYWHGLLALSGILSGTLFHRFTSLNFGCTASLLSALLFIFLCRKPAIPQRILDFADYSGESISRWERWPLLLLAGTVMVWNLYALNILPVRIWETLSYRAVMVGMWMQGEPLRGFESSSWASMAYPANAELLQLWWSIHTHSDRLMEMPQWLSALALADFVGLLAVDAGLPRAGRWWSAALVILIPALAIQAATEQDDLITCAAFAGGLIFMRHWLYASADAERVCSAAAAGTALGFALGCKVTVIPLLVPVLIWLAISVRRLSGRSIAMFAMTFSALGAYFYADNWIRLGNPLYPFPVRLFGITFFPADVSRGMPEFVPGLGNLLLHLSKAPLEWFELHTESTAFTEVTGFGALWPAMILPALAILAINVPPWKKPVSKGMWALACVLIGGQIMLWSNILWTPYDLRYSMHLPALGLVAAAWCWVQAPRPWRLLPSSMTIVLGAWTCGHIVINNWNTPISRVLEFRSLPFEQRTFARMRSMPEAALFATLESSETSPRAQSVVVLSSGSSLKSAAFGPNFDRRVWLPDPVRMNGQAAAGRWKKECETRNVDAVLIIDNAMSWELTGLKEARADLDDAQRWRKVLDESFAGARLLAYRRVSR